MPKTAIDPVYSTGERRQPSEADALMAELAKSIDISRLQFTRVRKDLADYHSMKKPDATVRIFGDHGNDENFTRSREIRTALYADVYFLMTSMYETDKVITKLKGLFPQEADLANLRNRHRPLLKRCSEFKAHMEHFDRNNGVEDFGHLTENTFKFHEKAIDLGPELERTAESMFCDLMSIWTKMSDRQRKIRSLISRAGAAS